MLFRLRHRLLNLSAVALALAPVPMASAAEAVQAPGEEIILTADDPLEIDGKSGEMVARKNARVEYGEWVLRADEIRVNQRSKDARATGNVLATRPGMRLLAQSAYYHYQTQKIEVEDFRFGQPPYYASGRRGHGTAEVMTFEDVQVYYGEPGFLTPNANVRILVVNRADKTLEAKSVRIAVGSIPVMVLGGVARPLSGPKLVWENRAGYDDLLGAQLGIGLFYPASEGFNPGGSVDVFTSRGVLFGPGARYEMERDQWQSEGSGDLLYIRDGGDRGVDAFGRPIDADRAIAQWWHQQRSDQWTLNGELNWWSDPFVVRDFRENAFDRNQEPDSFLEASWHGQNYVLSAFTRARPNDFRAVAERLPEVRFDVLPTPLKGTGILVRGNASAALLRERPVGDDDSADLRSDRIDLYANLSRTITVGRGVAITPVAGGRLTHYARATGGRDDYTRWLGEYGVDARLTASRVREMSRPLWGIDGIRHIIEPRLSYRHVPSATKGREFIPQIDRPAFLTQLQPLGLADRRDIDALEEIHAVRLALGNIVQTRREDHGSRQLLAFTLAGDIFLSDRADGRDNSDIHAETRLTPVDWLDWWFFLRMDPNDWSLREFNTRLTLVDGEAWTFGLDGDYLAGDIEQIGVFGRFEINEANDVFGAVRYDSREKRFNEVALEFHSQIAQNWLIQTGVVFRDGPRRESDFSLRLSLRFLAF